MALLLLLKDELGRMKDESNPDSSFILHPSSFKRIQSYPSENLQPLLKRRKRGRNGMMRAMVLTQPGSVAASLLRQADLPVPEPQPGEVRICVEVCGVCRTDLHVV